MAASPSMSRGRSLSLARDAFEKKDSKLSKIAHTQGDLIRVYESGHNEKENPVREAAVYSGFEGLCVSGALMAALSSTSLPLSQILSMCIGTMLPLAIGFGLRDFIRKRAEHEYYKHEREREEWELENFPEGEQKEMIELYEAMGISSSDAEVVIKTLSKYNKQFVDLMMLQELHIVPPEGSPVLTGLSSFCSFFFIGMLPLAVYFGRMAYTLGGDGEMLGPLPAGMATTAITSVALAGTNRGNPPRRMTYLLLFIALCSVLFLACARPSDSLFAWYNSVQLV
mmetsp:Transcript_4584/g.8947  ORF Transcript_4584/g.8947 Transcript_4584/m.8947 type:complete len:283 (+) Transcript_4584:15-863(+)